MKETEAPAEDNAAPPAPAQPAQAAPASDEEEEEAGEADEMAGLLASLTPRPGPADILLFAVPVCAPYATTAGYKFRAKLTPGTTKKGKACKSALNLFLRDKGASQREKDLLKATIDQDIGRNLPGKVKLSAPQLLASKKK